MQIIMLNTEAERGGAARAASGLAAAMRSLSGNISVRLYHCGKASGDETTISLRRPGARVINIIISRLVGSSRSVDFGVSGDFVDFSESADIVHLHNLHGYYLRYPELLKRLATRPVVWTWHDMWGATGRCAFSFNCEEWRVGCDPCAYLQYYPSAWIDRAANEYKLKRRLFSEFRRLVVVTPCEWLRDIAIASGFSEDNVVVVPNPIDISAYEVVDRLAARKRLGIKGDKFIALFVANDCGDPRKGYDDFAAAVKAAGVSAIAVGRRPKHQAPDVQHVGVVKCSKRLSLYYSAADILVLTSKADNYPNTVIESMACGTPVIGYGVGGIPSMIPEFCGEVIRPNDVAMLVQTLQSHNRMGGKSAAVSSKLRTYAENTWRPEIVARQYLKIYEGLLGARA